MMNRKSHRRPVTLAAALLLAAGGDAHAAPGAPHLVQEFPRAAIQAVAGDPLALVWNYYSAPAQGGSAPSTPYFMICLDESPQQPCSTPGAQWLAPATSIPSVAIVSSPPTSATIGRRYRFELSSVASSQLDRRLQWTVRSCLSESELTCSQFVTQHFYLSTKNLKARRINDLSGSTLLWIAGVAENTGTSSSGAFFADLFIAEAFRSPRGTCSTDIEEVVTEYGVIPDYALTPTGAEIDLRRLPKRMFGKLEIPDDSQLEPIVALYAAPGIDQRSFVLEQAANLGAGASQPVVEARMTNRKPTAYAQRLRVDSFDAVVEFNDEDNYVGECEVISCDIPAGEQECR